jgi:RHS repeat-associated protein
MKQSVALVKPRTAPTRGLYYRESSRRRNSYSLERGFYTENFSRGDYTGKELDSETGLYYYGARYMSPRESRWLSTDPALSSYFPTAGGDNSSLPGMGGIYNTVNMHLYHYAGNNPIKYTDPDGNEQSSAQKIWTQTLSKMDIKDQINIVIFRSKADNGHNGNYFKSELSVMWGNKFLNTVSVQSTADNSKINQPGYEGRTIPTGKYTGLFADKTGTYLEPIRISGNGVMLDEYMLIHPNVVTNPESDKYPGGPFVPPGSLGCQMLSLEDFNEVMGILHTLGFEVNDTIKIQILNKGYEE